MAQRSKKGKSRVELNSGSTIGDTPGLRGETPGLRHIPATRKALARLQAAAQQLRPETIRALVKLAEELASGHAQAPGRKSAR
jgi:hypothetical protein